MGGVRELGRVGWVQERIRVLGMGSEYLGMGIRGGIIQVHHHLHRRSTARRPDARRVRTPDAWRHQPVLGLSLAPTKMLMLHPSSRALQRSARGLRGPVAR